MFTKQRSIQLIFAMGFLYILLILIEFPFIFKAGFATVSQQWTRLPQTSLMKLKSTIETKHNVAVNPFPSGIFPSDIWPAQPPSQRLHVISELIFDRETLGSDDDGSSGELRKKATSAWEEGRKLWSELEASDKNWADKRELTLTRTTENCTNKISMSGEEFLKNRNMVELPCGLTIGSQLTVVGTPRKAREEMELVQFFVELKGLTKDGEEPPRLLHFNPRIKGDWSKKPVIELNSCFKKQWGDAQRCQGWRSNPNEHTVDGQVKCSSWRKNGTNEEQEQMSNLWLKSPRRTTKMADFEWPYPFARNKLFVITIRAGLEGFHVSVDGRHVASFFYDLGFSLEDATRLTVMGDVDVEAVYAGSLPAGRRAFTREGHVEMSEKWKAPPMTELPVDVFIGVVSSGNHFVERMTVRKSWMQHKAIQSSKVVARFFAALHADEEVNMELKREAEFFGDMVIVPYVDNYDLIVLKTVAICEYGIRKARAKYIMKCDDDTFVRVDAIFDGLEKVASGLSVYIGHMNYNRTPLREGKWAVTNEEWPDKEYPTYAEGPGYILSADIAQFVFSEFEKRRLKLFKMEDVSVGMWVEQFGGVTTVSYGHSEGFCQYGCIDGYFTAHYQTTGQMMCLWNKLVSTGRPECCN